MEVLEKKNVLIHKIRSINNESLLDDLMHVLENVSISEDFKNQWDKANTPEIFLQNMKIRLSKLAEKYDKIST
jgi:hypothetical protein